MSANRFRLLRPVSHVLCEGCHRPLCSRSHGSFNALGLSALGAQAREPGLGQVRDTCAILCQGRDLSGGT